MSDHDDIPCIDKIGDGVGGFESRIKTTSTDIRENQFQATFFALMVQKATRRRRTVVVTRRTIV